MVSLWRPTNSQMVRWTWELRRLKSDLTMMFSIIRGFVDIDFDSVYMRGHNRTGRHDGPT